MSEPPAVTVLRPDLAPPATPLFDVHVHVGPSDTGELFYPNMQPSEWETIIASGGVARSCVFPPLRDSYLRANEALADWAAGTGGAVLPVARLGGEIPWTTHQLWQLRRKLRGKLSIRRPDVGDLSRFAGVKLLPHLDGLPDDATFNRINELGLPIIVHGGIHVTAEWIESEVVSRTTGPVIIAHLGAFPAGDHELVQAVTVARRHERVYLDTSGVWLAAFLTYAAEKVGEKLVFGSDAPLTHPLVAWHHLRVAVQDDALLEQIGWYTPCRLFGIDPDDRPDGWRA
ncbi:amidohydrolase family protein [Euzebya tangerina]|uniref:amidohydrolase family protein n=1 Tax=Euzebya tangerina TaxID=591198 RepID=UPI000E315BE8|nr:amidohydrolase family protein [Euzebya tangerina]